MAVAKGQRLPDGSYKYCCGVCSGYGQVNGEDCPHCYNLDRGKILEAFTTAKGERYYALLKALLSLDGGAIVQMFRAMKAEQGRVSLADIATIHIHFGWPRNRWKPFLEWLEENQCVRYGTYEDFKEAGWKAKDVFEAGEKVLAERGKR